jgi:predicted RNA binding protein YcfA (HicA-like mRNA interferase family)
MLALRIMHPYTEYIGTQGATDMMSSREVIKVLKANGWELVATRGDHKKDGEGPKVTVQHPVKDLSLRNIISIENATGIRLRP